MTTRLELTHRTTPQPPLTVQAALPAPANPSLPSLNQFAPIHLEQMDSVALMDRADTKFVMTLNQLADLLPKLSSQYWMLDINGVRLFSYQTLYFDTPDFALYKSHHAEARSRYKVRGRRYAETNRAFMEVKYKTGHDRTTKRRIETNRLADHLTPDTESFIQAIENFPVDTHQLEPRLWNDYSRITLVNKQLPERVTLDLNMEFNSDNTFTTLPGVVIAEVKQVAPDRTSGFMRQMQAMYQRPTSFSKYCVGVALVYTEIKHNNFKPQLRLIEKTLAQHANSRGH